MTTTTLFSPTTQAGTALVRAGPILGIFLVLLTACFASGVQAEELLPIQGRSIAMGSVNGIAYYTNDATGSRVVATFGGDEGSAPVRVVTTLATGQSMTLSGPAGVGEPAIEVTFSRRGDRVFVDDSSALLETAR